MSRSAKDQRKKLAAQRHAEQRSADTGIWFAIVVVGALGLGLWFVIESAAQGPVETFPYGVIGFVIAVLVLINYSLWRAWSGKSLNIWQQTLARLPLRFAGFGTKGGKPLVAAAGKDTTRIVLFITVSLSALIVVAVTLLLT